MHLSVTLRSEIVKRVRAFFDARAYLEVHTPRMVALPGQEPYLDPFWTKLHDIHGKIFDRALITSPEYAMKKLLALGLEKIYDLGPCFRDGEPTDGSHAPEFLMIEWYRKGADLFSLMEETEDMVRSVGSGLRDAELARPFRRMTVAEAMRIYAHIELSDILDDREKLATLVMRRGGTVQTEDTWDDLFFKIFLTEVEPKLGWHNDKTIWQPTFLWNYPVSQASLAEKNPEDEHYALRTELYIGDLELGNGFQELTDAEEQRERFLEEISLRQLLGKQTWALDEDLLHALPKIGKASGMAFGVDRLVMLLAEIDKSAYLTNGL